MSEASADAIATSRNFEREILRRLATVKNDDVASVCGREVSWVSKLAAGETGLRLAQLQPFLEALGLKLVPAAAVSVDPEVLGAYKVLAKQALNGGEGR